MLRYLDGYYKIESYNLISKQPINRIRKGRVYKTGTLYTYEVTYFNGRKELEQKEIEL